MVVVGASVVKVMHKSSPGTKMISNSVRMSTHFEFAHLSCLVVAFSVPFQYQ